MALFDVHAHLTHDRLRPDLPKILARAEQAGVTTIIANGLNPADNQAVLELAQAHERIKPALGLYPVDAVLKSMRAAGEEYAWQREEWTSMTRCAGYSSMSARRLRWGRLAWMATG